MIDALHHAAHLRPRPHASSGAEDMLERAGLTATRPSSPHSRPCWRCCRCRRSFTGIDARRRRCRQRAATSRRWKSCAASPSPSGCDRAEAARTLRADLAPHEPAADQAWRLKYTPDDGDLVGCSTCRRWMPAVRYDRLTGYFSASALALAARGVEGLVLNGGRMRLVVGCTLDQPEVEAIERGEDVRARSSALTAARSTRCDPAGRTRSNCWPGWCARDCSKSGSRFPATSSVARYPPRACSTRKPASSRTRPATGSPSTALERNRGRLDPKLGEPERLHRRGSDPTRVEEEDANFATLWADQAAHVITLDVPRRDARTCCASCRRDEPARLKRSRHRRARRGACRAHRAAAGAAAARSAPGRVGVHRCRADAARRRRARRRGDRAR